MEKNNKNYIESGRWSSASWGLVISDLIPDQDKVTAVFGIPLHPDGLVMTKNHRGWELPGGHRESGETLKETLAREILEEAGIVEFKESENPIGYLEITDDAPKINKATGVEYPNPSYIIFYAVWTDKPLADHEGGETIDCGIFPFDKLPEMEGLTSISAIKHLLPLAKDFIKNSKFDK